MKKKALIIVDVTECFILERNKYIVSKISKLINDIDYDLFVSCIPYNKEGSLWIKQRGWNDLLNSKDNLEESIERSLIGKNDITINKLTKSAFKGDLSLENELKDRGIEEVHIVGFESNDYIIATSFEVFDLGFYSFVI